MPGVRGGEGGVDGAGEAGLGVVVGGGVVEGFGEGFLREGGEFLRHHALPLGGHAVCPAGGGAGGVASIGAFGGGV